MSWTAPALPAQSDTTATTTAGAPVPDGAPEPEPLPAPALDAHCHLDLIEAQVSEVAAAARQPDDRRRLWAAFRALPVG